VHRFVTIEQKIREELPGIASLDTLFDRWGLTHSTQEAFWVIALDSIEEIKIVTEVARGGFHDVIVHIPNVLAAVLAAQTDRFYVAHNHPAGEISPTEEDIHLTAQIMAAANAAGLSFEDHLIVGPAGETFSFWEAGILKRAEALGTRAALKRGGRR
jgi:DNA repair protein RadC